MKTLGYFIITSYIFINNKILSCSGPQRINKRDLIDVENGDIFNTLRKVGEVHKEVDNKTLKKDYDFILDQIIDNGKNKPEKMDNENKYERFVSYLYKLVIFFQLSNDSKSLVPVKCAKLENISNGQFYSDDYILFGLNSKKSQSHYFKKDVEKDINDNFKNHEFIKIEEIVKVFNKYKPDYFYIIVDKPDHSSETENPINYGFIFEHDKKHQNVFSDNVKIVENIGCC